MDFYELKLLTRTLVLPPTGPLLVAAVGYLMMRRARLQRLGSILCGLGLAVLWILSTPAVSGQLMKWGRIYPVLDLRSPPEAGAVIILAGGTRRYAPEYNDEAPNEYTMERLLYGVRVSRVTGIPVLITGGRGEARVMRDFLVTDFGQTPRWVEDKARDTRENAMYSAKMLAEDGISRVILVTSALHMPRAVREFRGQGMEVIPAPVVGYSPPEGLVAKWIPGMAGLRDSRNVIFELLATAAYALTDES